MTVVTADPLAALYQALGYQVFSHAGALWRDGGRLALVAEPSGALSTGSVRDIRDMLRRHGRLAAIFCTGTPSGKTVPLFTAATGFGTGGGRRQFNQQLRSARRHCAVRPITWAEWRDLGLACDRTALHRQGRSDAPLLDAACRSDVAEQAGGALDLLLFGCFAGERLAAYLAVRRRGEVCEGLVMHWDGELAALHPTHLLYTDAAALLLARPDVRELRIGRQAVPANTGLDRFKRHAGFEERPCHVAVLLHPWIAPLLETRLAARLLRGLRRTLSPVWPGAAALEVLELAAASRRALTACPQPP